MKNSDMPAMPVFSSDIGYLPEDARGLSKREYMAGLAMQNCLFNATDGCKEQHLEHMADFCVKAADTLLARLGRE